MASDTKRDSKQYVHYCIVHMFCMLFAGLGVIMRNLKQMCAVALAGAGPGVPHFCGSKGPLVQYSSTVVRLFHYTEAFYRY